MSKIQLDTKGTTIIIVCVSVYVGKAVWEIQSIKMSYVFVLLAFVFCPLLYHHIWGDLSYFMVLNMIYLFMTPQI